MSGHTADKPPQELRITRLRQLPLDTFSHASFDECGESHISDYRPEGKELLFDLQSILQAYDRNLIDKLAHPSTRNKILISEFVLHQLDMVNKESHDSSRVVNDGPHPVRVRDFINYLVSKKNEDWLEFQKKGSQEVRSYTPTTAPSEYPEDKVPLIKFALYKKRQGKDVILITSDRSIQEEAGGLSIETVGIETFDSLSRQ